MIKNKANYYHQVVVVKFKEKSWNNIFKEIMEFQDTQNNYQRIERILKEVSYIILS